MKKSSINRLNAKAIIGLAFLGTIISIAFVKSSKKENPTVINKNKVIPPLKNVDIIPAVYKVNADKVSKITYKTGSVISIPENAFVDESGKLITGEVEIKYREFHDPVDFFVSGIPMTYDSAGIQYHFESAGMLEILAYQNGKSVFVNPNKNIVVEMVSIQQDDKYNIYQYDSVAGNWKFIYKDKAGFDRKEEENKSNLNHSFVFKKPITAELLANNNVLDIVKPKRLNRKQYQFSLEVDTLEFPEIALYDDIQFEVDEKENDFNPVYASRIWADVEIKKNKSKGSYLMTLNRATETHTFEVNPVFDSIAYEVAYKQYEKIFKNRKDKELLVQRGNDSIKNALNKERLSQNDLTSEFTKNRIASIEKQEIVLRVFIVKGFGIWNSDCPAALPKGEQFAATYIDSVTGKKLQFKTLYLVEKGRNAMFAIASYDRLYYDPKKKNIIWAVTNDNKLAIFKEEKFKKLKKKNDKCTIAMKVIDMPIKNDADVKKILNI